MVEIIDPPFFLVLRWNHSRLRLTKLKLIKVISQSTGRRKRAIAIGITELFSEIQLLSILETCVALNFINNFRAPFKLYSSLKHEAYLVTGSGFKLKFIIDRPELHSHVIFKAEDPLGKRKIFLNGKPSTSEAAVVNCPEFVNVFVTPEQGEIESFN